MNDKNEFEKFDATVRKVLSVTRDELKQREAEWKRQHAGRKAGRKPTKTSTSAHVSDDKG